MTTTQRSDDGSHLFLVRLWLEPATAVGAPAEQEAVAPPAKWEGCHGRVQHVISGEAVSFVDWTTLAGAIRNMAGGSAAARIERPTPKRVESGK
ncbi:MAG: hypothetical protein M3014_06280 [Chloroflexota bacterium]|nr:hypothetical protein [Chloroflexota bacterium]